MSHAISADAASGHASARAIGCATVFPVTAGKLGMWVFLVSEIMFFTGLIGGYLVLRLGSHDWPRPGEILDTKLLGVNTLVLITSSLTMALSLDAMQRGLRARSARLLLATAALGAAFLSIKAYDYHHLWTHGFTLSASLFGSCYYLLTGFHGLHVLSGVILLLYLWVRALRGTITEANPGPIEYSGLYWHFIDLVWVFLFAILCLV